jgi:hypothetical protein
MKSTTINTRCEATQRVMAAKLTRLTHKIAIQLHLVAQSCTICSFLAPGGQSGNVWIQSRTVSYHSTSLGCALGNLGNEWLSDWMLYGRVDSRTAVLISYRSVKRVKSDICFWLRLFHHLHNAEDFLIACFHLWRLYTLFMTYYKFISQDDGDKNNDDDSNNII